MLVHIGLSKMYLCINYKTQKSIFCFKNQWLQIIYCYLVLNMTTVIISVDVHQMCFCFLNAILHYQIKNRNNEKRNSNFGFINTHYI
jgi:hypothetical protein